MDANANGGVHRTGSFCNSSRATHAHTHTHTHTHKHTHTHTNTLNAQIAKHRSGRSAGFAIISFHTHAGKLQNLCDAAIMTSISSLKVFVLHITTLLHTHTHTCTHVKTQAHSQPSAEAAIALSKLDQLNLMGRRLSVRWYSPSEGNNEGIQQHTQQQETVHPPTAQQPQDSLQLMATPQPVSKSAARTAEELATPQQGSSLGRLMGMWLNGPAIPPLSQQQVIRQRVMNILLKICRISFLLASQPPGKRYSL